MPQHNRDVTLSHTLRFLPRTRESAFIEQRLNERRDKHNWILLGIISKDNLTKNYQFHSVNSINNQQSTLPFSKLFNLQNNNLQNNNLQNNYLNNQSKITHFLYLHSYCYWDRHDPYCYTQFKLYDLKKKSLIILKDIVTENNFSLIYDSFWKSNIFKVIEPNKEEEIKLTTLIKENKMDDYEIVNYSFYIFNRRLDKIKFILNKKDVISSKIYNCNYLWIGNDEYFTKSKYLSLSNVFYLNKKIKNNEILEIYIPFLLENCKRYLFQVNNEDYENKIKLNDILNNYCKVYSFINFKIINCKEDLIDCCEQYFLCFEQITMEYHLFYFNNNNLQKITKLKLLNHLDFIDSCNLNENYYLLAMKRNNLKKINRVVTMEEALIYNYILFFLFDLNNLTIKEISPIIYPIFNNFTNIEDDDGFQLVSNSKRKFKIFINDRMNINGGITTEDLYKLYLNNGDNFSKLSKCITPFEGMEFNKFTMSSYKEFNETNNDIFTVQLTFNQKIKQKQAPNLFFITLYFKVKECCKGMFSGSYNDFTLLSDISICLIK